MSGPKVASFECFAEEKGALIDSNGPVANADLLVVYYKSISNAIIDNTESPMAIMFAVMSQLEPVQSAQYLKVKQHNVQNHSMWS